MNATIITGNDTAARSGTEGSATVAIYADHFTAVDMGFKVTVRLGLGLTAKVTLLGSALNVVLGCRMWRRCRSQGSWGSRRWRW
jgi:hypothetical protein